MFASVPYRILSVCLLLSALLGQRAAAQTAAPAFDMALRVLAPGGSNGRPYQYNFAVDATGSTYVCGIYYGEVFFNGVSSGVGQNDTYLAKIGPTGRPRWIKYLRTGGTSSSNAASLAVDAGGTVYMAGSYSASPFQLSSTISLPNAGRQDVFVARFDSAGNVLSAVRAGGQDYDVATHLALDAQGNAYVAGQFTNSASFGTASLVSVGQFDQFVARLDANGTWRWAQRFGGLGADGTTTLTTDRYGHVYTAGFFFGGVTQMGGLTIPNSFSCLTRLHAATGTVQLAHSLGSMIGFPGGNERAFANALDTDAAGNLYVGGSFLGTVQFGRTTLVNTWNITSLDDGFVAKLDTLGRWQWAQVVAEGNAGEHCQGLKLDRRGNIYISGHFRSPVTHFGPLSLSVQNPILSDSDVFIGKLSGSGQWQWVVAASGDRGEMCSGLVLGPYATPYIGGEFNSPSIRMAPLTVPGNSEFYPATYLARLQPNELRIAGDSVLCGGGSTQLTASTFAPNGQVSYRWSTGATTASISVATPGTYAVTATLPGGYALTEQFRVRSIPAPTVQINGAAAPLCPGSSRQLTAVAPGAGAFRWSTGATTPSITVTQPGTYTLTATFSAACAATTQVTVTGNTLAISGRQQLCPGQSTTLSTAAGGAAVTGYRWNTGATTPTLLVGQAGTYSVTATFADGCQLTRTHAVGPPVARVASVSGDTLLCANTALQLTALNPDALTYTWNTGATTPDIRISRPGLYAVLLTYAGGCTSRDSLLVEAAPLAPAFTLGNDTTLCLEQPLLLRAPVLSGAGLRYRWSDGSTGPTLTVTEPGSYALTVTSLCDVRTVTRRVSYQSCLFLPNVITPNGDGRNDRFVVNGLTKGAWQLEIYNRWGQQVFRAADYRHDWGPDAAPGTYYYRLSQGGTSYKGHVEVVR